MNEIILSFFKHRDRMSNYNEPIPAEIFIALVQNNISINYIEKKVLVNGKRVAKFFDRISTVPEDGKYLNITQVVFE